MERLIVGVFNGDAEANRGMHALRQLDQEHTLTIYNSAIGQRNADGTLTVQQFDQGLLTGVSANAVGGLIAVLGGADSAPKSALTALYDRARIGQDFIDDVNTTLSPGKVAIMVDVEEDATAPVDSGLETHGGIVFRRTLPTVSEAIREANIAATKADLELMKAEITNVKADRAAKLQKKLDDLQTRLEKQQDETDQRREEFKQREHAKRELLRKRAAAAGRALKQLADTRL